MILFLELLTEEEDFMRENNALKINKSPREKESKKYMMVSIGDNKFESNKIRVEVLSGNNYYQRIVAGKDIFQANIKIKDFENNLYNYKAFSFLGEKRNKKNIVEVFNQIIDLRNSKSDEIFNFKEKSNIDSKMIKNELGEIKTKGFENLR